MTDVTPNTEAGSLWRHGCAAALVGLPGMGPARLNALLADMPAETAWRYLAEGRRLPAPVYAACGTAAESMVAKWRRAVRRTHPLEVLERYAAGGVSVWCQLGEYPDCLVDDPWGPAVLFWKGTDEPLVLPRVAIVGTRRCTSQGRAIARRFGAELAEAGVSVVSGLALGIDGEAHRGALDAWSGAPVTAVVGSGLDRVYPARNAGLWHEVGERGLLMSEAPLGAAPEPWRFPARNRVIAGLADVVVVVESHERGGSLLTAVEAADRNVEVMAVPGSIDSPASRGTNELIREGCAPACSTNDILFMLSGRGLDSASDPVPDSRRLPHPDDEPVLAVIEFEPVPTDEVLARTGLPLGEAAAALTRLEQSGWIVNEGGWWRRLPPG